MEKTQPTRAAYMLTLTWSALTGMNLLYWLAMDVQLVGIVTTALLCALYVPAVMVVDG